MRWLLAAVVMSILLTPMVGDHNALVTDRVETAFACQFSEWSGKLMDKASPCPAGICLLASNGNNGDSENGEAAEDEKEKDLEADPAGGIDRIWNSVQLA
jgi:hypothetical protein